MAAEGDYGAGVWLQCIFVERQVGRSPFGSKKWSTELTIWIPTQKSKDASRTQNPPFASYLRPSEGKTSKDASRTEEKTQKKIAKYPIGRTQLASVRTKPTLLPLAHECRQQFKKKKIPQPTSDCGEGQTRRTPASETHSVSKAGCTMACMRR